MLFFEGATSTASMWQDGYIDDVVARHVNAAKILVAEGHNKIILAADNDGLLARMLSPRFSDWPLEKRMAIILRIFSELSKCVHEVWVLLTIEELVPGGMDATDGVRTAQVLEKLGLKTIVVTSGSKDFLPLYQRKMTKKKITQTDDFCSHEPSLASALWVRQNTTLTVWVCADIDNESEAIELITYVGIIGIISELEV